MRELLASGADGERWSAPTPTVEEQLDEVQLTTASASASGPRGANGTDRGDRGDAGDPGDGDDSTAARPWWRRPRTARTLAPLLLAAAVGVASGAWVQSSRDVAADERAAASAVSLVLVGAHPFGEGRNGSLRVRVEVHNAGPRPVSVVGLRLEGGLRAVGKPYIPLPRLDPGKRGGFGLSVEPPGCSGTGLSDEVTVRVRTEAGTEREVTMQSNDLLGLWTYARCGTRSFQNAYAGVRVSDVERRGARTTRLTLDFRRLDEARGESAAQIESITTSIGGVELEALAPLPVTVSSEAGAQVLVELRVGDCAAVTPPLDWSQGALEVSGRMVESSAPTETVAWTDTPVVIALANAVARACPEVDLA
ncbi:hypothetical protein [Motilibacter deserti]|uniref:Uncharacterized protein n=1 Tax=Motilibacter deserti TaxID=2714956 RepID=A0ABX0GU18_9ACTN|nr:hypothetical protein [Motilibacter deserti]NHC13245.1 hypothetical protein [Motilibacter deserti]